jgi:tetratricopeptide (TPR) repeat protein
VSLAAIAKTDGERGERYGEVLQLEAAILADLERHAEAAKHFARACEIVAFTSSDTSSQVGECWLSETVALSGLGKNREALGLLEKTLPIMVRAYGDVHPQVANTLLSRGLVHAELGQRAAAVADLEAAIKQFETFSLDPGHLAAAQWALAKTLWQSDPRRAKPLLEQALVTFDKAGASWAQTRTDAAEWLASNGRPKRR